MREQSLREVHDRIRACQGDGSLRPVTVCCFGDSNTRGMAIDPNRHRRAYPARLYAELSDRYAPCAFNVFDAGVPGDTMMKALGRLEDDVLRYGPDLTIVALGLNDAMSGLAGLERYRQSLHLALDRLLPTSAVILLTPGMLATANTDHVPPAHRHLIDQILATQHEGILDAYVETMCHVSVARQVALADTYALWQSLNSSGIDTTSLLADALNHPHAYMHDLAVVLIMVCLEMATTGQES